MNLLSDKLTLLTQGSEYCENDVVNDFYKKHTKTVNLERSKQ